MSTPIIQITDLYKTYGGASHPSVNGLTMTIEKGSIHGLLGPNGAGKTTTLSILCGLRSYHKGCVIINGLDIKKSLPHIKPMIGVVPQDIALYPELTIDENLRFAGSMYRIPAKILNERIDTCLQLFGLGAHRKKRISRLSGGMKRQVNLTAAVLHQPEILILDEPTVGIDVQSKQTILENLRTLNRNGTTILYTSHDMGEAQQFCTFVSLMNKGQIICEGTPSFLIRNENADSLEALFIARTGIRQINEYETV
jgi:ABC-2 type transport system ATP-binding protein